MTVLAPKSTARYDHLHCVSERYNGPVSIGRSAPPPIKENGSTAGPTTSFDILPRVSHYKRLLKVNVPPLREPVQHSRLGFPTHAPIRIIVRTNHNLIDADNVFKDSRHLPQVLLRQLPPGKVRLIGDDE